MSAVAFWAALSTLVYTTVLFPLLVELRGRVRPRPVRAARITPALTVVIAVHDEAESIGAKLESLLAVDYPRDRLEIVVASDGSSDATEEIVRGFSARGVHLVALPRVGKAAALNAAVARASGEVLVFSDANSMFARDALRELVAPLADAEVGGVAGNQRYSEGGDAASAAGENAYWDFDRRLKAAESRGGDVISATGAIYAIRRALFRPVPEGVTDDFGVSTRVVAQGRRLVFAPRAIAYEPVAASSGLEFARKVRVITRGLSAVILMRELLDPRRHGFYALQLFSHKVLRRLLVLPLAVVAAATVPLWDDGLLYRVAGVAQATLYGLGAIGLLAARRGWSPRLLALPAFFCLANAAAARAVWNVASGRRILHWEPQRAVTDK